jgi:hypothetical protein
MDKIILETCAQRFAFHHADALKMARTRHPETAKKREKAANTLQSRKVRPPLPDFLFKKIIRM